MGIMAMITDRPDYEQIVSYLRQLETRLRKVEALLKVEPEQEALTEAQHPELLAGTAEKADSLELDIGEYWFAKVGIVVLVIGLAFLLTLPYRNLPVLLPSLLGYLLVGAMTGASTLLRKSFGHLSRYFMGGALLLFYFATMRLHFFTDQPAVASRMAAIGLMAVAVAVYLTVAYRKKSVYLMGLGISTGFITVILSGQPYWIFSMTALLSALVVYFKFQRKWPALLTLGVLLAYFTHFVWSINNPFLGNPLQLVGAPLANLYFIMLYAALLGLGNLSMGEEVSENGIRITTTFLNCLGSFSLLLLLGLIKFPAHLAGVHFTAFLLYLGLAIVFWAREKSKFSTFFYAMTGYSALSIAIIAGFHKPDYFIWLSWQSIVVISTAIWFRSRFIIVTNFFIYILIFLAHLALAERHGMVILNFAIVALISARILNWKKDRLELKTELMRNAYLGAAFVMFPTALYQMVPNNFVSISWVGITLFYYLLSRLLDNKKYRWMAILTLLLTVGHVFVVDIWRLEPLYRVASFLILALALLATSLLYTRRRAKSS